MNINLNFPVSSHRQAMYNGTQHRRVDAPIRERKARVAIVTKDVIAPARHNRSSIILAREGHRVEVLQLKCDGSALVRHPNHDQYPPLSLLRADEFKL